MDPVIPGDTPPAEVEAPSTGDGKTAESAVVQQPTLMQQVETEMLGQPSTQPPTEKAATAEGEDAKDAKTEEGEAEKPTEDVDPELELARKGKLTPEVFQKRIGKEVGRRKGAEEAAEQAKAEADAAKAEAAELRTALDAKTLPARAQEAGLHPTLLLDSEDKVDAREEQIAQFKRWATSNAEGYEGPDGTGQPVVWTKEQIAEKVAELDYERERIAPRARKLITERKLQDQFAAAAYPSLFEPQSAEARIREGFLKRHPSLRMEANCNLIVGDMIAGEKQRMAAATVKKPVAAVLPRKAPPSPAVPSKSGRTEVIPHKSGRDVKLSEVDKNPRSLQDFMESVSEK